MPSFLVSAVSPVAKTHLCAEMPTWQLWAGAGQKAKHRLSSSLISFGGSDQDWLTCTFLQGTGDGADVLGGQGPPWEGCDALCRGGVSCPLLPSPEGGKLPSLGVMFVSPILLLCK